MATEAIAVDDLAVLLDRILWGLRLIIIEDGGDVRVFAFRPLTTQERSSAIFVRQHALSQALREGKPHREELVVDAQRNGLWTSHQDQLVEALRGELHSCNEELQEAIDADTNKKVGTRRIVIRKTRAQREGGSRVKKLRERISRIEQKLSILVEMHTKLIELPSAEHQADQEHAVYVIQCATMSFPSMKQLWPTYEDVLNETDTDLVTKLIRAYTEYNTLDIKKVRELARSGMWRIRWSTAKACGGYENLFHTPLSDLTPDQIMLLHWSQVYDSVYESIERPPDYVIEDDAELDKWLERQIKQQEQERRKNFQSKKSNLGVGKTNEANADEVMRPVDGFYSDTCNCGAIDRRGVRHASSCPYGVYFYYTDKDRITQEVEKVQSANPDQVRVVLAREQKKLEGKGWMREEHLRDDMVRKVMGLTTSIHKPGERPV